jgi:hypothetical protein
MRAERSFAYPNEPVRVQTRFTVAPIARKPPGMALQNLHPRFKSGRRLQNLLENLRVWVCACRRTRFLMLLNGLEFPASPNILIA